MKNSDAKKLVDEVVQSQTELIGGLLALRELTRDAARPLLANLEITRRKVLTRLDLPRRQGRADESGGTL